MSKEERRLGPLYPPSPSDMLAVIGIVLWFVVACLAAWLVCWLW